MVRFSIMKKLLSNLFSEQKLNFYILCFLGLTFLSIPLFSFVGNLFFITWVLTIILIGLILLSFIFYKPIKITIISISFVLFCVSALFSSLLTGFKSFLSTPLLNTLLIVILYTHFIVANPKERKKCFSVLYLSLIVFAVIYCITYRAEIFSLDFSRLGSEFGDENDISILLAFGFAFSFFYLFKSKKWYTLLLNTFFSLAFIGLSFTCGSKIAILIVLIVSFIIFAKHFGTKRWYLTILLMAVVIAGLIIVLQLPVFSTLKDRFLNMLYTFVGKQYKNLNPDSSTEGRLEMIINGFSLFLRRPLFGYGLNGYHVFSTHHSGWSHNHWSDTLCNYGLIGTFLYHLPFVLYLKKSTNKNNFSYIGIIFFLVSTLTIALFKEKMFAFSAGLFLADTDTASLLEFNLFRKKDKKIEISTSSKIELVEMIPSLNPVGGAETMFVNLCEEIRLHHSDQVNLNVIILYGCKPNSLYDRLSKLGINTYYLGKHRGVDFACASKLKELLSKINPTVIHTHLGTSITLMLALGFKKKYSIVHTFHHMVGTGFKKEVFNRFLIKKKYIHPVAVSKMSSESIEMKTKMKCDFIDNGINLDNFDSSVPMMARKIDFLCVASFRPVKNQKYLINVFKEVIKTKNDTNLVFLGDGPLKQQCANSAGDLLDKSITFKGAVDNVEEYMSKSKILVLPSISEGNPMVVNEAIASGMYVIANSVGGVSDLIKNGITGDLIELGDFEHFKESMLNRISDTSFLEQRRILNQSALDNYSIKQSANKYVELFETIISSKQNELFFDNSLENRSDFIK